MSITGVSGARARAFCLTRLAPLCIVLVLLASAECRLWEQNFNRPDILSLKSLDSGKVVTLLAEMDRVAEANTPSAHPELAVLSLLPPGWPVPSPALGHRRSRGPPV